MSNKARLLEETAGYFRERFGRGPELTVAAPGRANLIGEHTDYNDGHVLPVAIDRYIVAAAANRADGRFRLYAADFDEYFEFEKGGLPAQRPVWSAYVGGVIAELRRDGFEVGGKDIAIHGDVPPGSGLSSSAALEISTATAVERLEGLEIEDGRMVNICRRADHNYVGIKSGPMDQFASRACRAGHAGLLDCRALAMTHHPLPQGIDFFSIYSGIPRALVTSEYNERQESCQEAVRILAAENPGVKALRDATLELVGALKEKLGGRIFRRARHVVAEQGRVFALIEAFGRNDLSAIGDILLAGHISLIRDYEVSLPVLDEMITWLYARPGAVGARLTGAGFGGSLVFLAMEGELDAEELTGALAAEFGSGTPELPEVWKLKTVDGARYQPGAGA